MYIYQMETSLISLDKILNEGNGHALSPILFRKYNELRIFSSRAGEIMNYKKTLKYEY